MSKTLEMPVKLIAAGGQHHMGAFCWKEFDTRDRVVRAGVGAGMCLAIGAATLPIPIVHLVVPPLLLATAPVIAFLRYRIVNLPFLVAGKCPNCHQGIKIELEKTDAQPPLHKYCPNCDQPMRVIKNN